MSSVGGGVDGLSMTKALNKWVNLGIMKEREGGEFALLEVQEEGGAKFTGSRQGTILAHLLPPISPLTNE